MPPDKSRFRFQKLLQPFAVEPGVVAPVIWFLLDWLVLGVAIASLLVVDPWWVKVFASLVAALWIAREFVREPRKINPARLRLISLWAWFSFQPATFGLELISRLWTPEMQIGAALAAAEDWRTTIVLHLHLGREPITDIWLSASHMAGYDFLPLRSAAAITEEANAMSNCLRNYGHSLKHNRSRLWSVRRNGERVATLRIGYQQRDPLLSIVELESAGNKQAPRELWWVARQWLEAHDVSQIDTDPRRWGSVPLDSESWRSLWRPYWIAKRRIPEWLPVAPSRHPDPA